MVVAARRGAIERALSSIPSHPQPNAALEQYATPAPIAADVLFEAFALGDVGGRAVFDLGCGTGILGIGAALLGAMPVMGFDVDASSVAIAGQEATRLGAAQAEFFVEDVADVPSGADTVLTNPPFGAQTRHADRPFIEAAVRCGRVAYSFHMAETARWVRDRYAALGSVVTHEWPFRFPLKARFAFHDRPVRDIGVVVLRSERSSGSPIDDRT